MTRQNGIKIAGILGMFFLLLTANLVQAGAAKPLDAPADAAGAGHNAEGIKHFNMGMWDNAELHFKGAVKENDKLAEAHYNLALALDKLGNHKDATKHFAEANKLGASNPAIANSEILKKHLGM